MKNSRPKPRPKAYLCRRCVRTDFKTAMEFTNHLRLCRAVDVPVTKFPFPVGNGLREELIQLRNLGIEVRDLADKLLKKVK